MTRDDIIRMARETGMISDSHASGMISFLERFAALVVAAEREACALTCESIARDTYGMVTLREYGECAAAIRARGMK